MEFVFQENFDVLSLNTGYSISGNRVFQGENQQRFDTEVKNAVKSKFENVDRLVCRGDQYKSMQLLLDINSALYPVRVGEKLEIVLTLTLNPQGTTVDESTYQNEYHDSLINEYDYVMHGLVFKIDYENDKNRGGISSSVNDNAMIAIYVSYGGLLMKLSAEQKKLSHFKMDDNVYLLMKKLS